MKCDGDCFNCKFGDCVASYLEIDFLDRFEKKERKKKIKIDKETMAKKRIKSIFNRGN